MYDLIIVGAGLSGAHAAYVIKKKHKNMRILMIEGKSRVGGRTETVEKPSVLDPNKKTKWDLGGQWVGASQKNVMKLINELNVETYRQFTTGKKLLELNGQVSEYCKTVPSTSLFSKLDMENYITKLDEITEKISSVQPYSAENDVKDLDSKNLKDYLDSISYTPSVKGIFQSNIRGIAGLETEQVNGLFGLAYIRSSNGIESITGASEGAAQEKRMKGGAQQLTEKMIEFIRQQSTAGRDSEFKLMLNTQLVEIVQSEENEDEPVRVVTRSTLNNEMETFVARKVISSIPINQYVNVSFKPELPLYKRQVFKFCQIGNYTKFIVTYKTHFWRAKGYSGEMSSDGSVIHLSEDKFDAVYGKEKHKLSFNKRMPTIGAVVETFDCSTYDDEPAIVGFLAGNGSNEWGDLTMELRREEVIEGLVRYFGPEARNYVEYIEKNWAYEVSFFLKCFVIVMILLTISLKSNLILAVCWWMSKLEHHIEQRDEGLCESDTRAIHQCSPVRHRIGHRMDRLHGRRRRKWRTSGQRSLVRSLWRQVGH